MPAATPRITSGSNFSATACSALAIATWLYDLYPDEPEGKLSRRLNALVSGETCAEIGRELGVGRQAILGKQARDDGAADSDNVLGDIVEALIGALYLEAGLPAATAFIRTRLGRPRRSARTARRSIPNRRCRNGRRRTTASRRPIYWSAARARTTRRASSYRLQSRASARRAPKACPSRKRKPLPPRRCWRN